LKNELDFRRKELDSDQQTENMTMAMPSEIPNPRSPLAVLDLIWSTTLFVMGWHNIRTLQQSLYVIPHAYLSLLNLPSGQA
jgi:hypothetical protein